MADEVMELEAIDLGEAEQSEEQLEGEEAEKPVEGEESPDGDEAEGEEEQPVEEEPEPAKVVNDGRTLPGPLKAAAAALKTSNPEGAKMIRANYFENQQFKQQFATPAEAAAAKQQYEELGGPEAVAQMQAEREEWAAIDQAVAEGKAAELLKDNPELLQKNAVGVINEFAKTAPEQYGYYADQVAINRVQQSGALGVMGELYKGMARFVEQNPELKPYIEPFVGQVVDAHNRIIDIGERAQKFAEKRTDPREEQLSRDRAQFEQTRRADFEGQVYNDATAYLATAVDKAIGGLLNGRKADDDQMAIFREKVTREVENRLSQVPGFAQNLDAQYRTGNRGQSVDYIKRQYDKILTTGKAADVIAPLLRTFNPAPASKSNQERRSGVSKVSTTPGVVNLPDMPDWDKVDWNKTSTAEYASGKAVLTNGKQARW